MKKKTIAVRWDGEVKRQRNNRFAKERNMALNSSIAFKGLMQMESNLKLAVMW